MPDIDVKVQATPRSRKDFVSDQAVRWVSRLR